jgi:hypothetical protein
MHKALMNARRKMPRDQDFNTSVKAKLHDHTPVPAGSAAIKIARCMHGQPLEPRAPSS